MSRARYRLLGSADSNGAVQFPWQIRDNSLVQHEGNASAMEVTPVLLSDSFTPVLEPETAIPAKDLAVTSLRT